MLEGLNPHEPAEITLPWLAWILQQNNVIPVAELRSVEVETISNGSGYSGELARWWLEFDRVGTNTPRSIIVKSANRNPNVRGLMLPLTQREVFFYQQLAVDVGVATPHCYYAAVNQANGAALLLLEDLNDCVFPNDIAGCTRQETASTLSHLLARFHAKWWEHPRLSELAWLPVYMTNPERDFLAYRQLWPHFVAQFGEYVPAAFLALGSTLFDDFATIYATFFGLAAQPPHTLQHGDFRLNNLAFKVGTRNGDEQRNGVDYPLENGDAEFLLFDWHTPTIGRGAFDVARFLVTSLSVDNRRAWESNLLQDYHRGLVDCGVEGYPFSLFLRDYQIGLVQNLIHHVVASVVLGLTNTDALAMHRSVGQRLSALIEDHDLVQMLRDPALSR